MFSGSQEESKVEVLYPVTCYACFCCMFTLVLSFNEEFKVYNQVKYYMVLIYFSELIVVNIFLIRPGEEKEY